MRDIFPTWLFLLAPVLVPVGTIDASEAPGCETALQWSKAYSNVRLLPTAGGSTTTLTASSTARRLAAKAMPSRSTKAQSRCAA